jgi:hypothetical protein
MSCRTNARVMEKDMGRCRKGLFQEEGPAVHSSRRKGCSGV